MNSTRIFFLSLSLTWFFEKEFFSSRHPFLRNLKNYYHYYFFCSPLFYFELIFSVCVRSVILFVARKWKEIGCKEMVNKSLIWFTYDLHVCASALFPLTSHSAQLYPPPHLLLLPPIFSYAQITCDQLIEAMCGAPPPGSYSFSRSTLLLPPSPCEFWRVSQRFSETLVLLSSFLPTPFPPYLNPTTPRQAVLLLTLQPSLGQIVHY